MNQQTMKNTARKIAKYHALDFMPGITVIRPPCSSRIAS